VSWTPADGREIVAMRRAMEAAAVALRDIADAAMSAATSDDARDDDGACHRVTCPECRGAGIHFPCETCDSCGTVAA